MEGNAAATVMEPNLIDMFLRRRRRGHEYETKDLETVRGRLSFTGTGCSSTPS